MHCNVMIIMKYFLKLSSEQLCIEIAWEAIVLSGNKHFPGGVHYPGAISRVAIIWGYISVVNYSAGQQFECHFRGAIVRGAIIRGAIIWGQSCCFRQIRIRIIFVSTDCSFHFALKDKISVSASSPLTIKHKVNHNSSISMSGITP